MSKEQAFAIAEANRRLAADMFAGLTEEQWRTPSLCAGWTVREVAGHLVHPLEDDFRPRVVLRAIVRYRGNLDRLIDDRSRESAARPTTELVGRLRELAATRLDPPFVGVGGPMTDTCIHLRDAARPLGLPVTPTLDDWRAALDFLVSKRTFLPRGRTKGLQLVATDQDWSWGSGSEVRGPSEAIALAISGRPVALPELTGPGLAILAERIGD